MKNILLAILFVALVLVMCLSLNSSEPNRCRQYGPGWDREDIGNWDPVQYCTNENGERRQLE